MGRSQLQGHLVPDEVIPHVDAVLQDHVQKPVPIRPDDMEPLPVRRDAHFVLDFRFHVFCRVRRLDEECENQKGPLHQDVDPKIITRISIIRSITTIIIIIIISLYGYAPA